MKKSIMALITALSMLSPIGALADEEKAHIEISMCVGDSTVIINGTEETVNAPYIAGDGVTLVPLRVITEAFGAEVNWNADSESAELSYPGVDIIIKIGSKAVVVNEHTEELEAAAEINNDVTMVPLRFICETFGAQVSYDEETKVITVTKAAENDREVTLAGTTDKDYIGDSYYGWTMSNPKSYIMQDVHSDNSNFYFTCDYGAISIRIEESMEGFDAGSQYNDLILSTYGDIVTDTSYEEKDNGITRLHVRKSGQYSNADSAVYIKGCYLYKVTASYDKEIEEKDLYDILSITESFSITEKNRDFYDFSNIKDDMKEFKNEKYKINGLCPAAWLISDYADENEVRATDKENEKKGVFIRVYSKARNISAEEMSKKDYDSVVYISNPSIVTVGEVDSIEINGMNALGYTVECGGKNDNEYVSQKAFVELGEYIYEIVVRADSKEEISNVLQTIELEELDPEEIGNIIRTIDLVMDSRTEFGGGTASLPKYWSSDSYYSDSVGEMRTDSRLYIYESDEESTDIPTLIKKYITETMRFDRIENTGNAKTVKINDKTITYMDFKVLLDDNEAYYTGYTFTHGKTTYIAIFAREDLCYNSELDKDVLNIIGGITYPKK